MRITLLSLPYSRAVRRITVLTVCAMQFVHSAGFVLSAQVRLLPGEVIQHTGDVQLTDPDLVNFFARTDLAFLGTINSVTPLFLAAPDGTDTVFTRMTFKPTEFIKGSPPAAFDGTLDVWKLGGSYVDTSTGRQPLHPAHIAQLLLPGLVYFVAVTTIEGYPSLSGRYIMSAGDDTLVRIDGNQAAVLGDTDRTWVDSVTAQGRATATMSTPGTMVDDSTAFLGAVGRAASSSQ